MSTRHLSRIPLFKAPLVTTDNIPFKLQPDIPDKHNSCMFSKDVDDSIMYIPTHDVTFADDWQCQYSLPLPLISARTMVECLQGFKLARLPPEDSSVKTLRYAA
jgi:hypothetical protein